MKKNIKLIFIFIIGITISVVINVYAATVIAASEVSYTPGSVTGTSNVSTALDAEYTRLNTLSTHMTSLAGSIKFVKVSKSVSVAVNTATVYTLNSSESTCGSGYVYMGVINYSNSSSLQVSWTHYDHGGNIIAFVRNVGTSTITSTIYGSVVCLKFGANNNTAAYAVSGW